MSGCADVCLNDDFDCDNEFYSECSRVARKPYKCVECRKPINPGQRHHYATGKNDGSFFHERTCSPCAEVRSVLCCGGWMFGMLWESARDDLFPMWHKLGFELGAIECLAKLSSLEARDKCREEYKLWTEDLKDA